MTDPTTIAEDALLLARTGRWSMAERLLETLPSLLEAELERLTWQFYVKGFAAGQRSAQAMEQKRTKPAAAPASRGFQRLQELRAAVTDHEKRQLVLAALKLDERDLHLILLGRSSLSAGQWRRVKAVLV